MNKFLTLLSFVFLTVSNVHAQSIDSLALSNKEIPDGYGLTKENNCVSVQACIFYRNPALYEALIGKLKFKRCQSFDSKKDKGSIMYFEFEDDFKANTFLSSLLWGGDKPTKAHPEEYYVKGRFLIIWSFKKDSLVTKVSQEKIAALLK